MTRAQYLFFCCLAVALGALVAASLPETGKVPAGRIIPLGSSGWALVVR
jgi:hypothetical protein